MVTSKKDDNPLGKRPPAKSVEGNENRLIALAYDVVERKLLAGTASSQETTFFLKLGTQREIKEQLRLEQDILLSKAKIDQLNSFTNMEVVAKEALDAFRGYLPSADDDIV